MVRGSHNFRLMVGVPREGTLALFLGCFTADELREVNVDYVSISDIEEQDANGLADRDSAVTSPSRLSNLSLTTRSEPRPARNAHEDVVSWLSPAVNDVPRHTCELICKVSSLSFFFCLNIISVTEWRS